MRPNSGVGSEGDLHDVINDHTASIRLLQRPFEEFLLMRQLGMEPIDCIRSATTVAAHTIGMEGVGTLAPGSWGDLIGVPGDPLADLMLLSNPDKVYLVVKGGEVVKSVK